MLLAVSTTATTDAALGELANSLGRSVGRLSRALSRETAEVSRTSLSVLATLREHPHRITELAALEHVAQPTMTVLVSRLEGRGWVERAADPHDRRAVNVTLTRAGAKLLEELVARRTATLAARLAALSEAERQTLARALPLLDRIAESGEPRG
jgi:DNA-binding MarR family transcriptional regulator